MKWLLALLARTRKPAPRTQAFYTPECFTRSTESLLCESECNAHQYQYLEN